MSYNDNDNNDSYGSSGRQGTTGGYGQDDGIGRDSGVNADGSYGSSRNEGLGDSSYGSSDRTLWSKQITPPGNGDIYVELPC
ncbi:hypothetical protein CKM354_000807200 [Cercospora kikuchii]|uniref:Uncharacterized protein n=1 Tax=Cercospora kikuchii TaxID=84275 RepID=A0A9P3CNZ2_9PEZI|nr:uncharacterized protein CKM354_000807200 [Cercospora kikuchii]GIZ44887.1 hypothetical protein CKM354_000807200 [Cercospora kikuchii]